MYGYSMNNKTFWNAANREQLPSDRSHAGQTREERITAFNKIAEQCQCPRSLAITNNFLGKTISRVPTSLTDLKPISIKDLQVGITHRKRVLYARIVSRVSQMVSAMVLIEDENRNELADLAVYGLPKESAKTVLKEKRCLAIIEPHYKIRQDGSPGIRVDNVDDIIFDATFETSTEEEAVPPQPDTIADEEIMVNLEDRLKAIFASDPTLGVDKVFRKITAEGYNATKKQVRALKKTTLDFQKSEDETPQSLPAILSERRPEDHRLYTTQVILDYRRAGKEAFEQGDYERAEAHFSSAVGLTKTADASRTSAEPTASNGDCVARWQLIGNRSAARYKLGKLDEALQDALRSNQCAPNDELKPILRCAEILFALGMKEEMIQLLNDAGAAFPNHSAAFLRKRSQLEPPQLLWVGPDKQYRTIVQALRDARIGAEIVVDPGIYTEALVLTKPVTLRSSKQVSVVDTLSNESSDGLQDGLYPEIRVKGRTAVVCSPEPIDKPVRIVGFKIACHGNPQNCYHALDVRTGVVVIRNSLLTCSSGPVACVHKDGPLQFQMSFFGRQLSSKKPSRLILHSCKVYDGAQGGILVTRKSALSLRQVHVTGNAACGLELREGGCAQVENCHFYGNGKQGVMLWMSAGRLDAKHCWIHSNLQDSGALVSECEEAQFESCEFYGNGVAGVATQKRGLLYLTKCLVHDNYQGVLIQDTGSAQVQKCKVFRNRANGIFVAYDHKGQATITENHVHSNVSNGIEIGNKGKSVRVIGNKEENNKGLLPQTPDFIRQRYNPSRKHERSVKKNESTIKKAMREQSPTGGFMGLFPHSVQREETFFKMSDSMATSCWYCGKSPSGDRQFSKCSKCKEVSYCSRECQRKDWPRHKIGCISKDIKYPSFLDRDKSVPRWL